MYSTGQRNKFSGCYLRPAVYADDQELNEKAAVLMAGIFTGTANDSTGTDTSDLSDGSLQDLTDDNGTAENTERSADRGITVIG